MKSFSKRLFFAVALFTSATAVAATEIRGTVDLAPALAAKLKPTATLYVMAKRADGAMPMPIAVLRVAQPLKFPLEFKLSEENAMMPGLKLEGKLAISARISQEGPATPAKAGDLESKAPPTTMNATDKMKVTIVLDQVRK